MSDPLVWETVERASSALDLVWTIPAPAVDLLWIIPDKDFNEEQHPRVPAGGPGGGEFTSGGGDSTDRPLIGIVAPVALARTIRIAEDKIRNETNEHAVIVDTDGVTLAELTSNNPTYVQISKDIAVANAILTHNHPSGNSLSVQDGVTASDRNLSEIRAVVARGTYSLRRTEDMWPADFKAIIDVAQESVQAEFRTAINLNKMNVAEANVRHYDLMWTRAVAMINGAVVGAKPRVIYAFEPKR